MGKRAAVLPIAILLLSCAPSAPPAEAPAAAESGLVLPGTFSEGTTLADLKARFGAENLRVEEVTDGPDSTSLVALLYPDDPTRRATVRFWDGETMQHLASVTVTDPESTWRGKLGVRIGTTFAELRALNGVEFFYSGFADDGSGSMRDGWNAGALDVAEGDSLYFGLDLSLRLLPGVELGTVAPNGEPQLSSDDPRFPRVGELTVVTALTAWSSLDDEWALRRPSRAAPSATAPVIASSAPAGSGTSTEKVASCEPLPTTSSIPEL